MTKSAGVVGRGWVEVPLGAGAAAVDQQAPTRRITHRAHIIATALGTVGRTELAVGLVGDLVVASAAEALEGGVEVAGGGAGEAGGTVGAGRAVVGADTAGG